MSAISASQDTRPQLVSVQHLTAGLESAQGAERAPLNRARGRNKGPALKPAMSGPRKQPLPPLRLTRRGRVVLIGIPLVILAAILLSLAGFLTSPAKAADSAAGLAVTPTVTVTVQAGESLWAIAGAAAPGRDARDVIADIVQLNNLTAGGVMPGQQLFVPTQ
jgi:LysM domain